MNTAQRTYVITGSSSGIGAATSNLLTKRGWRVIRVDLHDADVIADLGSSSGRADAIAGVLKTSGGIIDAIIPCAGLIHGILPTVSVNFFGVTQFVNGLLPILKNSPAPRVATMSSVASLLPNSPQLVDAMMDDDEQKALEIAQGLIDEGPKSAGLIYSSTKGAISQWVRRESIKPEWAGAGIPLNAVGPGIVETPMMSKVLASDKLRSATDAMIPMPLNYHLKPMEVAYLLAWLTSEENSHITGQTIFIDGGSDALLRGAKIWE